MSYLGLISEPDYLSLNGFLIYFEVSSDLGQRDSRANPFKNLGIDFWFLVKFISPMCFGCENVFALFAFVVGVILAIMSRSRIAVFYTEVASDTTFRAADWLEIQFMLVV